MARWLADAAIVDDGKDQNAAVINVVVDDMPSVLVAARLRFLIDLASKTRIVAHKSEAIQHLVTVPKGVIYPKTLITIFEHCLEVGRREFGEIELTHERPSAPPPPERRLRKFRP